MTRVPDVGHVPEGHGGNESNLTELEAERLRLLTVIALREGRITPDWRSPRWIIIPHPPDQLRDFWLQPRPPSFPSRSPSPVPTETLALLANHRLRLEQH